MAWVAEAVVPVESPARALQLAAVNDPYRNAFVEESIEIPTLADPPGVSVTFPNARTIEVTLEESPRDFTFLTVSSSWMPGWRAVTGEGEWAEVMPSHGFLLGVVLPPGTESVRLQYAPFSFRLGAGLSAIGILLGPLMLRLRLQKEGRPSV